MIRYVIRRLIQTIIVVFGVSFISFGLMFLTGDPTILILGPGADLMTQEEIDEFRVARGFDRPWYEQYFDFARNAIKGDFGISFRYQQSAFSVVMDRIPATVQLATVALLISVTIAVPVSVISVTRPNTWMDRLATLIALVGQSIPSFWLGILLMILFGVWLKWLPISGRGEWKHLVLPGITLAGFPLARNMRLFRSSLIDVIHQDYIRTARAKGLRKNAIMYKHAMRNALLPMITAVGLQMGFLLGGSVIIETIFAWPGVGRLIINAIYNKDFPIVLAGVTMLAVIFTLINLAVDLMYGWIDPRIRLGD